MLLMLATGCETNPYDDSTVDIKPPDSGQVLSVEEEGDMVCITEKSDPDLRLCVPRVHEADK